MQELIGDWHSPLHLAKVVKGDARADVRGVCTCIHMYMCVRNSLTTFSKYERKWPADSSSTL